MRAFRRVTLLAMLVWLGSVTFTQVSLHLPFRLWVSGEQRWMHALDSQLGCRIFLVGSSAVLYGLSAEQLERSSGCRTINTALSGIGTEVTSYLELILQQTRPDDVVVLSDRDWLAQDGVEDRCHFERRDIPWLRLPRLVPSLGSLYGVRSAWDRTAFGDLAALPPLTGVQVRMKAKNLNRNVDCRRRVLQHQLQLLMQHKVTPVFAPPPMLAKPGDVLALRAELQAISDRLEPVVEPYIWVRPLVDIDERIFSLEGQHTSALGRQRWTDEVAIALRQFQLKSGHIGQ